MIRLWKREHRRRINCGELDQCPCNHKWPLLHPLGLAKCKNCDCYNILGRISKPTTVWIGGGRL